MIFRQLFDSESSTYTYLLACEKTREGILIDPVLSKVERDLKVVDELGIKILYCLETHIHADHITGAGRIRALKGSKTALGAGAKVDCADLFLKDGELLKFGTLSLRTLATPGHTDSCTSYFCVDRVFTGDALMIRGCGRTDFQEGSSERLYQSVHEKLFTLPDETLVFPAHDYKGISNSSIGEEKKFNPRLGGGKSTSDFVDIMANLKLDPPKKIMEAVPANLSCGQVI